MKIDPTTLARIGEQLQRTPYDGPVHRVMVDGVPLIVTIKVDEQEYPSCARVETTLGVTLDWEEKRDTWEGFSRGQHVATVRKRRITA